MQRGRVNRRGEGGGEKTNPVGAELELHVDVAFVLEAMFEGDDVGVLHCLVDLDLSEELLQRNSSSAQLGVRLVEREKTDLALVLGALELFLGDYFESFGSDPIWLGREVHPCESALLERAS